MLALVHFIATQGRTARVCREHTEQKHIMVMCSLPPHALKAILGRRTDIAVTECFEPWRDAQKVACIEQ